VPDRPPLGVWLYDECVAEISSTAPGTVACTYTDAARTRWPGGVPLLSCSLPLRARRYRDAHTYFRGLLPEGRALQAMADLARVPTFDTFGMLARFGRDVAGAVVIANDTPPDRPGDALVYTSAELDDEITNLDDRPLGLHDDSELSLAGLQNKLLLVSTPDGWARPIGGRPSTHILKVEDRRFPGLVTLEAECLRLARAIGLTSVTVDVTQYSGIDCLIVSRFDRRIVDGAVERIHQEDACQALGRDPEANDRRGKYQASGGPSLVDIASVLDRHAEDPLAQLRRLVEVVTFTVAIGNSDAHGKNLSFLHTDPGVVQLAPLYDTVPTALWPQLPDRAAMTIADRTRLGDVTLGDIVAEATTWHVDASFARATALALLERLRTAVDEQPVSQGLSALVGQRCAALVA
jgi:serine/threonine-protein kinase HipA